MGKVQKVKSDRDIAISLGVDPFRFDKGDIIATTAAKKSERRAQSVFSPLIYGWLRDGKISIGAYEVAKDIATTLEELAGSSFKSQLDMDVIASAAGKSANKIPAGYNDHALERPLKIRNWQAVAGDMWPALVGVCGYGMNIEDAAKLVKRRKGFVSASILHILEGLALTKA